MAYKYICENAALKHDTLSVTYHSNDTYTSTGNTGSKHQQ